MKCVYCFQDNETRFRGVEHVVPQSFGTFGGGTPTLGCVCDGIVTLSSEGRKKSTSRIFLSDRDCYLPRIHRRGTKVSVRLG